MYTLLIIFPDIGALLECTLKTFIKTLIFIARLLLYGSSVSSIEITLPSAAERTALAFEFIFLVGSLKNCILKTNKITKKINYYILSVIKLQFLEYFLTYHIEKLISKK